MHAKSLSTGVPVISVANVFILIVMLKLARVTAKLALTDLAPTPAYGLSVCVCGVQVIECGLLHVAVYDPRRQQGTALSMDVAVSDVIKPWLTGL
jgi:hypothetical protein